MAKSTTGTLGTNPGVPSPQTAGPLGTNKDAADPATPDWFRGDTAGPLGTNDYADPDTKMCRIRTSIGIAGHAPGFSSATSRPLGLFGVESLRSVSVPTSSAPPTRTTGMGSADKPDESSTWTVEDEEKVRQIVSEALTRNRNDVALAFGYTRNLRQKAENYYDMNLAIASDYLRARWETLKWGPSVARAKLESYMELKKRELITPQGPGPVSPYSALEHKWMKLGVTDQMTQPDKDVGVYWDRLEEGLRFIGERMHD